MHPSPPLPPLPDYLRSLLCCYVQGATIASPDAFTFNIPYWIEQEATNARACQFVLCAITHFNPLCRCCAVAPCSQKSYGFSAAVRGGFIYGGFHIEHPLIQAGLRGGAVFDDPAQTNDSIAVPLQECFKVGLMDNSRHVSDCALDPRSLSQRESHGVMESSVRPYIQGHIRRRRRR